MTTEPGVPPSVPPAAVFPWQEWRVRGIPDAFVETVRQLATDPVAAFSRLRRDGDLASPLLFGLGVTLVGTAAQIVFSILFRGALLSLPGTDPRALVGLVGGGVVSVIGIMVLLPVLFLVSCFVISALLHGGLLVAGGLERSGVGFEGTVKVVCYSSVSGLCAIVPFVGGFAALVVSILLQVLGLRTVHATTTGRALVAVLVPWVLCCALGIAAMVAFAATLAGLMAGAG